MKNIIFVITVVLFYGDKVGQIGEKLQGPIWQCYIYDREAETTLETKNCTRYENPDEDKLQKKN
jgi:hypothetical protein